MARRRCSGGARLHWRTGQRCASSTARQPLPAPLPVQPTKPRPTNARTRLWSPKPASTTAATWRHPHVKTSLLLIGALSLFLSACGTSPVRADAPATDLEVMRLGVEALTQPREPAGEVQRSEDAATAGQAWDLLLDLEDLDYLHEQDKHRLRVFVNKSLDAIAASRAEPCRWWQRACHARNAGRLAGPPRPAQGGAGTTPAPRPP